MSTVLSAADYERLQSWAVEIACTLLPGVAPYVEGNDLRFNGHGGLVVHRHRGCWYSYAEGRGGSVLELISLLGRYSREDAIQWAIAWLASHPGTGSCTEIDNDDEDGASRALAAHNKFECEQALKNSVAVAGTNAEVYLTQARGIPGPYADCVQYLHDARVGEGALVGLLRSHDRVVGVQITYLDAFGSKSLVWPQRRRFMLEKAPDAVFEIPSTAGIVDKDADLLVFEGLEDLLSGNMLGWPVRLIGLPGVGTLKHIKIRKGERVVVIRDGDQPGAPADNALVKGLDNLLLQEAAVRITHTPSGADANSILRKEGPDALRELIANATSAVLSIEGQVARLASLDPIAYDQQRKEAADQLDIRLGTLDRMVRDRRPGTGTKPASQSDVLIELAEEAELFHTPDNVGYADIRVGGHRETWPIRSKSFKRWLAGRFFEKTDGAPNSEALQAAFGVIESKAQFKSPEEKVHVRVADLDDSVYIDLADSEWRAVALDAAGWRVVSDPPVRFRRTNGMRPLPVPHRGGDIDDLRPFLNLSDERDFILMVMWVLTALRGRGPFPVAALHGEPGTAKTTAAMVLRALVDPNRAAMRSPPRDDRDVFIAGNNGHVIGIDNLSGLPTWMSNALCRISTGGGYATRLLYSDDDEAIFDVRIPVILTGIGNYITRSDLADRSLRFVLEAIPETARRSDNEFWEAFDEAQPKIFGVLLDGVVRGLNEFANVNLERKPRMADFAIWGVACEGAFWESGTFMRAHDASKADFLEDLIEADPVSGALRKFMNGRDEWSGTATELLAELNAQAGDTVKQSDIWPKTADKLSGTLREAAPNLRSVGINIRRGRKSGGGSGGKRTRKIRITCLPDRIAETASPESPPSPCEENSKFSNGSNASREGDASGIEGDASGIEGDASGIEGDDDGGAVPDTRPPYNRLNRNNFVSRGDEGDAILPLSFGSCEKGIFGNGAADKPLTNGSASQDDDPPPNKPKKPLTSLKALLAEMTALHPDWSPERLAKHLGQPPSRIRPLLGIAESPGAPH
jgi:hypothetical protein